MISYSLSITESFYALITSFSTRTVGTIEIDSIDLIFFYKFPYDIFWVSAIYRESSSGFLEITIYRLERFSDESESHTTLTEILYRARIMDKNRKNF